MPRNITTYSLFYSTLIAATPSVPTATTIDMSNSGPGHTRSSSNGSSSSEPSPTTPTFPGLASPSLILRLEEMDAYDLARYLSKHTNKLSRAKTDAEREKHLVKIRAAREIENRRATPAYETRYRMAEPDLGAELRLVDTPAPLRELRAEAAKISGKKTEWVMSRQEEIRLTMKLEGMSDWMVERYREKHLRKLMHWKTRQELQKERAKLRVAGKVLAGRGIVVEDPVEEDATLVGMQSYTESDAEYQYGYLDATWTPRLRGGAAWN